MYTIFFSKALEIIRGDHSPLKKKTEKKENKKIYIIINVLLLFRCR